MLRLRKGMFYIENTCYVGLVKYALQKGAIYKDGNKLGKRKTKLVRDLYSEKLHKRFESFDIENCVTKLEFEEYMKSRGLLDE